MTGHKANLSRLFWGVLGAFCLLLWAGAAFASAAENLDREGRMALDLRLRISRTPAAEAEAREELYLGLIRECPRTLAAQEALWALSDLYLDGFEDPREEAAREVLELFLERYPASPWSVHVKNRLVSLYRGAGNPERLASLCEELLRGERDPLGRLSLAWTCALAYEKAGDTNGAKRWFSFIVKEYASDPEARDAQKRLAALGKGKK